MSPLEQAAITFVEAYRAAKDTDQKFAAQRQRQYQRAWGQLCDEIKKVTDERTTPG